MANESKPMKHMTQEEALAELQAAFPDRAQYFRLVREHSIGMQYGCMDEFCIWQHYGSRQILANSNRSWEHAVAIAKSGNEDIWPEDHSPIVEDSQ